MPRKIKTTTFVDALYITKINYLKILMWSQSEKEINFICFGNAKTIKKVSRLSNLSRYPKNYSIESENERKLLVKEKKKAGYKVLANGHSHPQKHHDKHPSRIDVKYIKKNTTELIAFPCSGEVRAWRIKPTVTETLLNQVTIIII